MQPSTAQFRQPLIGNPRLRVAAALALASVIGCGPQRPAMVPVTGTVLYQGMPVEQASVTFIAEAGRPASGVSDAQGRFQLTTFETNDGAVLGKHTVTIVKWIKVDDENVPGARSIRKVPSMSNPSEFVTIANFLPDHYGDMQESGLQAIVKADGENDFVFNLTD